MKKTFVSLSNREPIPNQRTASHTMAESLIEQVVTKSLRSDAVSLNVRQGRPVRPINTESRIVESRDRSVAKMRLGLREDLITFDDIGVGHLDEDPIDDELDIPFEGDVTDGVFESEDDELLDEDRAFYNAQLKKYRSQGMDLATARARASADNKKANEKAKNAAKRQKRKERNAAKRRKMSDRKQAAKEKVFSKGGATAYNYRGQWYMKTVDSRGRVVKRKVKDGATARRLVAAARDRHAARNRNEESLIQATYRQLLREGFNRKQSLAFVEMMVEGSGMGKRTLNEGILTMLSMGLVRKILKLFGYLTTAAVSKLLRMNPNGYGIRLSDIWRLKPNDSYDPEEMFVTAGEGRIPGRIRMLSRTLIVIRRVLRRRIYQTPGMRGKLIHGMMLAGRVFDRFLGWAMNFVERRVWKVGNLTPEMYHGRAGLDDDIKSTPSFMAALTLLAGIFIVFSGLTGGASFGAVVAGSGLLKALLTLFQADAIILFVFAMLGLILDGIKTWFRLMGKFQSNRPYDAEPINQDLFAPRRRRYGA